eukprot:TRINITY_DN18592_c0_g1_i1.p1 TRINITY_DN18592_c0_g1~~TRINITY_DN18592_c0_g1_i1.p1  ORF type:complete len:989 (+),score=249.53 TRINITY_DN18592_c0_g1_i1:180-3146(+)
MAVRSRGGERLWAWRFLLLEVLFIISLEAGKQELEKSSALAGEDKAFVFDPPADDGSADSVRETQNADSEKASQGSSEAAKSSLAEGSLDSRASSSNDEAHRDDAVRPRHRAHEHKNKHEERRHKKREKGNDDDTSAVETKRQKTKKHARKHHHSADPADEQSDKPVTLTAEPSAGRIWSLSSGNKEEMVSKQSASASAVEVEAKSAANEPDEDSADASSGASPVTISAKSQGDSAARVLAREARAETDVDANGEGELDASAKEEKVATKSKRKRRTSVMKKESKEEKQRRLKEARKRDMAKLAKMDDDDQRAWHMKAVEERKLRERARPRPSRELSPKDTEAGAPRHEVGLLRAEDHSPRRAKQKASERELVESQASPLRGLSPATEAAEAAKARLHEAKAHRSGAAADAALEQRSSADQRRLNDYPWDEGGDAARSESWTSGGGVRVERERLQRSGKLALVVHQLTRRWSGVVIKILRIAIMVALALLLVYVVKSRIATLQEASTSAAGAAATFGKNVTGSLSGLQAWLAKLVPSASSKKEGESAEAAAAAAAPALAARKAPAPPRRSTSSSRYGATPAPLNLGLPFGEIGKWTNEVEENLAELKRERLSGTSRRLSAARAEMEDAAVVLIQSAFRGARARRGLAQLLAHRRRPIAALVIENVEARNLPATSTFGGCDPMVEFRLCYGADPSATGVELVPAAFACTEQKENDAHPKWNQTLYLHGVVDSSDAYLQIVLWDCGLAGNRPIGHASARLRELIGRGCLAGLTSGQCRPQLFGRFQSCLGDAASTDDVGAMLGVSVKASIGCTALRTWRIRVACASGLSAARWAGGGIGSLLELQLLRRDPRRHENDDMAEDVIWTEQARASSADSQGPRFDADFSVDIPAATSWFLRLAISAAGPAGRRGGGPAASSATCYEAIVAVQDLLEDIVSETRAKATAEKSKEMVLQLQHRGNGDPVDTARDPAVMLVSKFSFSTACSPAPGP